MQDSTAPQSVKVALLKLLFLLLLLGITLVGKMDLKIGKMRRSLDDEKTFYEPTIVNMQKPKLMKEEDQFDVRRQILEMGCKNLNRMQELVDEGDFDKLFKFHEDIYNRNNLKNNGEKKCNGPNTENSKAKRVSARHKVNIFYEDITKMSICLPPKAGTTNFQDALAQLRGLHGRGILPRLNNSDYRDASEIISKSQIFVLNTRNPFERILSAWRDKFHSSASAERQEQFKPSIDIFEEAEIPIPNGYVSSFPAFVNHLAANPSEFTRNRHWRSTYYHCSPCHFPYEVITHLETIDEDFPEVWKRVGHEMPHMKQQYNKSPTKSKDASFYYSGIASDIVKQLYINYYQDFVLFGYSPQLVKEILQASSVEKQPDEEKQKISRAQMGFENQESIQNP